MHKKGFTLFEMMIVIVIIGLLFLALTPTIGVYLARGRDTARITDLTNIYKATQIYENENGTYPTAMKEFPKNYSNIVYEYFDFVPEIHANVGPPPIPRTDDNCLSYIGDPKFAQILPVIPRDPQKKNPFPCLDSAGVGSYGYSTGTDSGGKNYLLLTAELETPPMANIGLLEIESSLQGNYLIPLQNKKKGDYIESPGNIPYYIIYD